MKKQIIISALALGAFVLGTSNVQAQTSLPIGSTSNSVSTTVNIKLSDVISIDSGAAVDGIVNFNYTTAAEYNTARNVPVPNSLVVTSSKDFDVKVKADGPDFVNGSNLIPVDVLQIKASAEGLATAASFADITLSDADKVLITKAKLGAKRSFSIDYSISAEKAQTVLLGKPVGTYTAKVTYTATVN